MHLTVQITIRILSNYYQIIMRNSSIFYCADITANCVTVGRHTGDPERQLQRYNSSGELLHPYSYRLLQLVLYGLIHTVS